jgi:hypothetical protein
MDYLEFIAGVTSQIAEKGQLTVRYSGLYANAHRGKVRKASPGPFHLRMVEELLMDKKTEDLAGEKFRQSRVVDPGHLVDDARIIHSALRHQEMKVGAEIDLGSERLNGRDHISKL